MKKTYLTLMTGSMMLGVTSAVGTIATVNGYNPFNLGASALECVHAGNHYAYLAATDEADGHQEFWACCKCGESWGEAPEKGSFTDVPDSVMIGGVPEKFVIESAQWIKDEEQSYDATYATAGLLVEYKSSDPTVTRQTPTTAQKDDAEFVVTADNPYLIANVADWDAFATKASGDKCQDEFYKLTADLGNETEPISTFVNNTTSGMFAGSFDGNNHSMTVDLTRANGRSGLFAFVTTGGIVKNLSLYGNVASPSGKDHAAAFVADMRGGTLSNLTNYATITARSYVGGIVAFVNTNAGVTITGCVNYGAITANIASGSSLAGGIAGSVEKATTFSNCANYGNVTAATDRVGGIASQLKGGVSTIENCTNGYAVLPEGKTQPTISVNMGATTGKFAGGIVGSTETAGCSIVGSANYGNVQGNNGISGILGLSNVNSTLTNNTNAGNITGVANTGGIIGRIAGSKTATLSGNTNTGTVKIGEVVATEEVGGTASTNTTPGTIVGSNGGTIK